MRHCFNKCEPFKFIGKTAEAYENAGKCYFCDVYILKEYLIGLKCPCCRQQVRLHAKYKKTRYQRSEAVIRY